MNIKKYISLFLVLAFFCFDSACFALDFVQNINGVVRKLRIENDKSDRSKKKEYKLKSVLKHYDPYILTIKNNNTKPVLLRADSELLFHNKITDCEIASEARRDIYRKSRKRDMGRYYWVGIPCAIISGGVTGMSFFILAPVAGLIFVGGMKPTDSAVRNNVKISQDIFVNYDFPIRIEPNKTYEVHLLVPKDTPIKFVKITNVSLGMNEYYDMKFPVVTEEKL